MCGGVLVGVFDISGDDVVRSVATYYYSSPLIIATIFGKFLL